MLESVLSMYDGADMENQTGVMAKKCSAHGCSHPAVARDLCGTHYKRFLRHGHILQTRPADWGLRERHPLNDSWRHMFRSKGSVHPDWQDFWKFVEAVGDRPTEVHRLARLEKDKPMGPGNWYWQEHLNTQNDRADRAAYMREYTKARRAADPWHEFKYSLKRHYGLTIDQYLTMHDAQLGVCAICSQPEKSVDPKTKRVRRLGVDHCHESKKIRALLCSKCNGALGHFNDNIGVMKKAIEYLEKHKP